ncbi:hypothetical protein B1748_28225 [Paenibacillus sp. MY03]|uniref:S-layer homology domain-containing protein n=1 Tax=Paenibacillus sp. MY03 TaxID=302980 RepID=UPI000B3C4F5A|nr:S-layer homology domain-containing protein [Paenibacillus sp. MY03]OUS70634.1 hypothetical protein B1748_28225 [Paenibacillus sp. MY03]
MYKHTWKWTICLLILSLLIPSAAFANAQGSKPELEVKSVQAGLGQSAAVEIVINRPKGLKTFEFTLHYDRDALEIADRDVAQGADVTGWMFEHKVNASSGTVRIAAVHVDGFKSNNPVAIAQLTFKAKKSGVKPFKVTDLKGFVEVNTPADMTSKAGTFTVQGVLWTVNVSVDNKATQEVVIDDGHVKRTTIRVDAPNPSRSVRLELEQETMQKIAASGKILAILTPIGSLEIDSLDLKQLGNSRVDIQIDKANGTEQKPARTIVITADGKVIESFYGKLKLSIPYERANAETNQGIVAYRTMGGQRTIISQSAMLDGQVLIAANEAGTYEIGYNAKTFTDAANHWSKPNIEFAAARNLFLGVGNERFAPDESVTRGMFVTVLGRMLGIEGVASVNAFQDVSSDAYYAPYIAYADEHGIVNGIGAGEFAPDRQITREEMAIMIARFMHHAKIESPSTNESRPFEDLEAISIWAASSVRQLQSAGILSGKPGGLFDPQGHVTRAEAAKVVRMVLETSLL